MQRFRPVILGAMALFAAHAWGQPPGGPPGIGYLYPAGAQQGTTVRVTAGGQNLRGASSVIVVGTGVRVSVVEYVRALNNGQLGDIAKHIRALVKKRMAEAGIPVQNLPPRRDGTEDKPEEELPELPDHPLLRGLETKSLKELDELRRKLFDPKRQQNAQIADQVIMDVTVDADAPPGYRELRIVTGEGLTNPLWFQVGNAPEALEQEPNEPGAPAQTALALPVVLNGQIMPGDVDRFRFSAREGQRLVIEAQARRLIPYLADAVPGWFQATLALFDAAGREVAFTDDYRFNPDPVIMYEVPRDGEYCVEIRDSIYRGREDFVYRISLGEHPFITSIFPLGARVGTQTVVSAQGWNLPWDSVVLDTAPGIETVRVGAWQCGGGVSNPVPYQVSDLPEIEESSAANAKPPCIINGRIEKPGERDAFRFNATRGETVVVEVYARRLGSPLDSLLRITNNAGHVLALNDDHEDKSTGLITHHADSRVSFTPTEDGTYCAVLADAQSHGGSEYGYRLHIGPPKPRFSLRIAPASVTINAGRSAPVCVYALREDGFDGAIDLALMGAPPALTLSGGRIPAGCDRVRMTLDAAFELQGSQFVLQVAGSAQIGGKMITVPAIPSQDMMQAFAYRHLVPSQAMVGHVNPTRRFAPPIALAGAGPLRIPAGGNAAVHVIIPAGPALQSIQVDLSEPPDGLSVQEVKRRNNGLELVVRADGEKLKTGTTGNLILEAFAEVELQAPGGQGKKQKRRFSLGYLPAVPFEVTGG
ncbi:MAG: hypothetical protein HPY44_13290 [Armatimonadetes bacterium]|nr:hypothetical protein [Armatimonadota bacterium]